MSNHESERTMDALVWTGPREMEVRSEPIPEVEPDEVLIRVAYCGICGSELSGYLGHNALRVPPLVMGHEFSGEIAAVGDEVPDVHPTLEEGAHVTADPMIFDRTCPYCQEGLNHLCLNRTLVGAHRPGGFADYVAVPAHQVFLLPPEVDLRTGALTEPTACAMRISELAGVLNTASGVSDVLIIGAGTIGLLSLQVLRHRGVGRVFIVDTNQDRLAVGAALGGEALDPRDVDIVDHVLNATDGMGVEVALDAVGKALTREQCVAATARGGLVLLSGLHEEVSKMPVADIIRREITAQGSFCYTPGNVSEAIHLLAEGAIDTESWIVDSPLSEGGEWFRRLVDDPGKAAKVLLRP